MMSAAEPKSRNHAATNGDTRHRKTRNSWDEPGHAHFLSFSCTQRLPLLAKDRARGWVVSALEQTRSTLGVSLIAYVIMPEHVHVLLVPQGETPMRRILASLKRSVSQNARTHLETTAQHTWLDRLTVRYPSRTVFRFWQPGGGHDHNIWKERTMRQVVDYIHENPVRRGLVDSADDWVWSSSRFWSGETDVPIVMDSIEW